MKRQLYLDTSAYLCILLGDAGSLDITHLRTAAWFHAQAPLSALVTLDTAQAQAARELGLPT